jgi:hypothetical protein
VAGVGAYVLVPSNEHERLEALKAEILATGDCKKPAAENSLSVAALLAGKERTTRASLATKLNMGDVAIECRHCAANSTLLAAFSSISSCET